MPDHPIALFAPEASRAFAARVADRLGIEPSPLEEREFEDGEHKSRPLSSVRGRDVYVLQSLHADERHSVNDKLCRLLFLLGCLRDASAARITALVPYLAYARKDRRTQPHDPVTTRYVAALFEAVGVDRIVALEVHNPAAYQNAFRCRCEHLETWPLLVDHFATRLDPSTPLTVVSPDSGGVKRAERFRAALARRLGREPGLAFMEKTRTEGRLTIGRLVGEVASSCAILIDDLISTGGTLLGAARACRENGAAQVHAAAAHGLFVGNARQLLDDPALDRVVVTDTVPPFRLDPALVENRLEVLPASALFAAAIRCLHEDGSLADLLEHWPAPG